ncbi:hypothetical protein EON78_03990, partial [bacterium]
KALSSEYFQEKLVKLIANDNGIANGSKIVTELQYAKYKGETVIPFKAMSTANPSLYTTITSVAAVITERANDEPFNIFIAGGNPTPISSNIIYVNSLQTTGLNNGTSWTNAYNSLQDALTNSTSGKDIWVAKGIYKPTTGTDKNISFQLKSGVNLYGGFSGTETEFTQRNSNTNITILSGDLNNSNSANAGDSSHIIYSEQVNNATLDGFTIKHGFENSYGGGGALFNLASSPTLTNLIFSNNSAYYGGAIHNASSSPTITNVTFSNNSSFYNGGAVYNTHGANPILKNVIFSGNSSASGYGGGAIYNYISSPTLTNVVFSNNSAIQAKGGAILNDSYSAPTIINSVFSNNSAALGGGIYNYESSLTIFNSTFSNNSVGYDGGGSIYNFDSSLTITNSILWSTLTQNSTIYNSYSTPIISYSDIKGGNNLNNNISSDPLFVDSANPAGADGKFFTADDGLALQSTSPAKNIGTLAGAPQNNILGISNTGTINMGAY